MSRVCRVAVVVALALGCAGGGPPAGEPAKAASEKGGTDGEHETTLYTLGLSLAPALAPYALSEQEFGVVVEGLEDAVFERARRVDVRSYLSRLEGLARSRRQVMAEREREFAEAFLSERAGEPDAWISDSGLIFLELQPGSGIAPEPTDTVRVHYTGTLRDGTVFDSSVRRGEPALIPLDRVIPCWREALQRMSVGGKARLTCPAEIAYGDTGHPPAIKPGAALSFEVEILEIVGRPGARR